MSERPFTGLTARVQLNGVLIGYISDVDLNLSKDIAEISQFGAQYKEKLVLFHIYMVLVHMC